MVAQPPLRTYSACSQLLVCLSVTSRALALGAAWNWVTQIGLSAETVAASARAPAERSAVEPVTQPPQPKPTIASATAPVVAPHRKGLVSAGSLKKSMVSPPCL